MAHWLFNANDYNSESSALVFGSNRVVAYGDLAHRCREIARQFGHSKKLIAIEACCSEHGIIAYLGALFSSHAVAMLPPDNQAVWDGFTARFSPDIAVRKRGQRWSVDKLDGGGGMLHPDLALLLPTSGSTGIAKSVRLSRDNLRANATSIVDYLGLTRDDRSALILPLHYCYGLSVLHSHLAAGASLYLPGGSILDESFAEKVRAHGCSNIAGVPNSYRLLEQIGFRTSEQPALRFMTVAGGRLEPEQVRLYRQYMEGKDGRFFVMYGQTEATSRITYPGKFMAARI